MHLDDFSKVAGAALRSIDQLLAAWFPQGVVEGREFCIGSASGEAGKSMRVRLTGDKAGFWSDFSSDGEAGRDLVSLYAHIHGIRQWKACLILAQELGVALSDDDKYQGAKPVSRPKPPQPQKRALAQAGGGDDAVKKNKPRTEWEPILPVPKGAGAYPVAHPIRGLSERYWAYRDQNGDLLGVVHRFRTADGGKEILPCVYARHPDTGKADWRWMQWREPRPLYLPAPLRDGFPVLVVEGEKCTDAAQLMFSSTHDAASWPGGGKAVAKADWRQLAGRHAVLWADADAKRYKKGHAREGEFMDEHDQPGMKTMLQLKAILLELGCTVSMIDIPAPHEPHHIWDVDEPEHDGWDIAALVECGATEDEARAWLQRLRGNAQEDVEDVEQVEQVEGDDIPDWVTTEASIDSNVVPVRPGAAAPAASSPPPAAGAGNWTRKQIREKMIATGNGGVKGCRENVYTALMLDPCLCGLVGLDQFTMLLMKCKSPPWNSEPGEWTEGDDFKLGVYLAEHYGLVVAAIVDIERGIAQAGRENAFNPVAELFEACFEEWDGQPRVAEAFSTYWGAPASEYLSVVSRMFFVGLAKRVYVPGVKHDNAPVFEGGQGEGKSTALSVLGGDWFADTPFRMGDTDGYLSIQGVFIYEIAELEQFNRSEVTTVKAFMSSQKDRYREPYGRRMKNQLRRTVFAATTNEGQYFKDTSGNRRFWPVETGRIDTAALQRDRRQLFGEAVALMRAGALWYPTRDEQKRLITPQQESREIYDEWTGRIWDYLEGTGDDGRPIMASKIEKVTARELITKALHIEIGKISQAKTESMRISVIMRKLGWKKKRQSDGAREHYYLRPEEVPKVAEVAQAGEDEHESLPF